MRNGNQVTQYEAVAIRMAFDAGANVRDLAGRYSRSPSTIRRVLGKKRAEKIKVGKPRKTPVTIDREPVTASEVCRYVEGGSTSVSHGLGAEHAQRTLAAMMRGRTPLPGYPRTEEVE